MERDSRGFEAVGKTPLQQNPSLAIRRIREEMFSPTQSLAESSTQLILHTIEMPRAVPVACPDDTPRECCSLKDPTSQNQVKNSVPR